MQRGAIGTRRLVAVSVALLCFASCTQSSGSAGGSASLSRLEQFGFVPRGRSSLSLESDSGTLAIELSEPLLVGMYEVTRSEFAQYRAAASPTLDPLLLERIGRWSDADAALPMSFVTRPEAAAFASWADARLLTRREWLFCAISPRDFAYPWSDAWQQGRANTLDLGLYPKAPTFVGTFEGGRTATHLYDMLGNVWEWVDDDLATAAEAQSNATFLGGSYSFYKQEIHLKGKYFEQSIQPGARFEDVGFRICSPARGWLEAHAEDLERDGEARARLAAVGRRWGTHAVPLLSELSRSSTGAARRSLEAILGGARE